MEIQIFVLRNGVLSYSKIHRPENLTTDDDVRFIGDVFVGRLKRLNSCGSRSNKNQKSVGIVHLKVLKFIFIFYILLVVEVEVTNIGKLFNCSFGGGGGWLW
ncbi:putative oxysterol-binding protein [Helianthus annuus]|uniref:Oxysterol-binding protein n=1 Tax=Helianthus annuus TaxID=4232 RepID=A0A9K3HKB2_HELAN|nr:putative oxysterol-binding protein [Helianthus annuus]